MKGCKVIKAGPSNAIDIFPLLLNATKEGIFPEGHTPTQDQLQHFYFHKLLKFELIDNRHLYYLARRGRGFLGFLHAIIVPNRWDDSPDCVILDLIYVVPKRRKMGVGKKLLNKLYEDLDALGLTKVELLSKDDNLKYWEGNGFSKLTNVMRK